MCTRQIRALALSILLVSTLFSVPAAAAPSRDDGGRTIAPIERAVHTITKFIAHVLDELTLPRP